MLAQMPAPKAQATIRVDVTTSLEQNPTLKVLPPHNCIKMDNKLWDQKSKDQALLDRQEVLDPTESG